MKLLRRVGRWLADRLGLPTLWETLAKHRVPPGTTSSRTGWMYVLGFAAVGLFVLQIVTGTALLTRYIPATGSAYQSIRILTEEAWVGGLVRGMHFWGASAMVLFVLLHMARVFLTGSYKFPREMNWITGVGLLVLVLAMAFTGQLLRWNQDGLWGVVVASQYAGRVPLIGAELKAFILAGDSVGGATLSRFFAAHVVVMPLLIIGLLGVHLYLVLYHGISEAPEAGEPVDRTSYRERYRALLDRYGHSYWPDAAWQEVVVAAAAVVAVLLAGAWLGAPDLGEPPDPASVPRHPRPDWFLMWYYALIAVKPRGLEDAAMVYLPLLMLAGLLILPLVRPEGERAPSRRPWAVGSVLILTLVFGSLTWVGYRGSWVPALDTSPLTERELGDAGPAALRGARIFHAEGCQACHTVAGRGGAWGPDLTRVMARMGSNTVVDRIVNGTERMPSYRETLSGEDLSSILAFLAAVEERSTP